MVKVFTVDGIEVSADELREILNDEDEWTVKTYEEFKHYTAETLLDAANFYFNQTPPDMIQAAEKLWLAAVFSVKKLFLNLNVHIVSHSALKIFCNLALRSMDFQIDVKLSKAWTIAESLHSFSYGGFMHKNTFDNKKKEVENFVHVFSSIDPNAIKFEVDNFIANPTDDLNVEKKSGKIMIMAQQILEHCNKASQLTLDFRDKWLSILNKHSVKFQTIVSELILEPLESNNSDTNEMPELSIHAQYMLEECIAKLREVFVEMYQDHRQIHPPVSKCGKDLDRFFQSNISRLLRNEKDIESNNEYCQTANQLIFEHFLSLGRINVADIFMKESSKLGSSFNIPCEVDLVFMRNIMESFRSRNFLPAIQWVENNASEKRDLLFRLHTEHIFQLLKIGCKKEAVIYCRALQTFAQKYKNKISHLMFMTVSWPNINKTRYDYMFNKDRWLSLEKDLSSCISQFRCPLTNLLNIGARVIPPILTLRTLQQRHGPSTTLNENAVVITDELPHSVPIEERAHSSFTCPILRSQSTESNPPMRLGCGHVISNDALNKLAGQSRNLRLKCPYCPEESSQSDAVQLYF